MENIIIGMDFGTTNTSVAYMKYNNISSSFIPECFNIDNRNMIRSSITYKDENRFWIGEDALKHSYEYPNRYIDSLKRQVIQDTLRDKSFGNKTEVDILSDFFSEIMKKIELQIPYESIIDGVAIGIPVGFRDRHKDLYLRSLVKAGIYDNYERANKKTLFVSEPIAAVLNYNLSLSDDKRILVFDFGGGTLDLVIMDMKNIRKANELSLHDVVSKKGRLDIGGNDFDMAILENIVIEKYGMRKLKRDLGINQFGNIWTVQEGIELMTQIKYAKEDLSRYEFATIAFEKGNLSMNLEITREEYELAIASYLRDIRNIVNECLSDAGLSPNDIDIVVLSGGSSLTPAVQKILGETFGNNKLRVDGSALTSIARGLALRGYDPDANKYNDILEHNYGVKMKDEKGKNVSIKHVLKKGKKINDINIGECYREFELDMNARARNTFRVKICENDEEIGEAHVPITDEMVNSKFKLYFTIDENNERLELHIYDLHWDRRVEVPMEYRFVELNR